MATNAGIEVVASNSRMSTYLPDDATARDVDVVVTFPANEDERALVLRGEVTVVERDGRLVRAGGEPDSWISGRLLAQMRARTRAEEGVTAEMYAALERAAARA